MPYNYRDLSEEERDEVLTQRRLRGHPRHAPPHPFRKSGRFLITAANFEHRAVMQPPERRTDFEARLLKALHEQQNDLFAWVVLPNHYHVLLWTPAFAALSAVFQRLHGTTAYEWNRADGLTGQRQVWYRYADRKIRDDAHFYQAMNYLHYNPVKHGYVTSPYDWPWSSLQQYLDANGRQWLVDTWKENPVTDFGHDFGEGWDDDPVLEEAERAQRKNT